MLLLQHVAAASRAAAPCSVLRPRRVLPSPTQRRWLVELPHLHLPGNGPAGLVGIDSAIQTQARHRLAMVQWSALPLKIRNKKPRPDPICFSFVSEPVYTFGRSQAYPSPEQQAQLKANLTTRLHLKGFEPKKVHFNPSVRSTKRGGLTTYHGPGQLVIWPVVNLALLDTANIGVARYVSLVQLTTQDFLFKRFNIVTTALPGEPGVWVDEDGTRPRKIAAVGMHFKRYVTAFGVAINLDVPVQGPPEVNPWARIVPCGIEDKGVTSVAAELGVDRLDVDYAKLGAEWVKIFEDIVNRCPGPAGLWPRKAPRKADMQNAA